MGIKNMRLWKKIALGAVSGFFIIMGGSNISRAEGTYTCETGGVPYASLAEAVEAAGKSGTATITMIADETLTDYIALRDNQNITLDLAGFHIDYPDSSGYNAIEIDSGCFTLNDSVGTGSISSGNDHYGIVMVAGGEFVMNGGTIAENGNPDINETGIYANEGKITINGGTVNAKFPFQIYGKTDDGTDLTINGGTFQGQLNAHVSGNVRAVINGGKFSVSGDDEALMVWLQEYTSGVPQVKIQGGEYHGLAAGISIYNTDYYEGYTYSLEDILGDGYIWSDDTQTQPQSNVVYSAKDVTVYPVLSESNVTIEGLEDVTYTGKEIMPELTISYKGKVLEQGRDYEVQYSNHQNAGTAEVTITFHAPYAGVIHTSFQILKHPQVIMVPLDNYNKKQTDSPFGLNVSLSQGDGTLTYSSSDTGIASVDENGTVTLKGKSGEAVITIAVSETNNYQAAQQKVIVKVEAEPSNTNNDTNNDTNNNISGNTDNTSGNTRTGNVTGSSTGTELSGNAVLENTTSENVTASQKAAPKTGDHAVIAGLIAVVAVSGLGLGYEMTRFKKRKIKNGIDK